MRFYRIARADRGATALAGFSGEGAAKYPGRWNRKGYRAVYCADTLAGACLETLVHMRPPPRRFPESVYFFIDIEDRLVEKPELARLPKNWNASVAPNQTRDFGTEFLESHRAVAVVVPTVIIPLGLVAVINPVHPKFADQPISGPHPFFYDHRLE